jgi:hypothetical protein
MHNCKAMRARMNEFLLQKPDTHPGPELNVCEECREEFNALEGALRLTAQVFHSTSRQQTDWYEYHQRLQHQLNQRNSQRESPNRTPMIRRLFTASIRVPVPIAVAVVLACASAVVVVSHRPSRGPALPVISTVGARTEIPVAPEKIVTRIVYRPSKRQSRQSNSYPRTNSLVLATSQKKRAPSLIGFKPLDDLRFTLIKGGTPDEK